MPIGHPKMVKCKKCKKTYPVIVGDVRPQQVKCPYCNYTWMIHTGKYFELKRQGL